MTDQVFINPESERPPILSVGKEVFELIDQLSASRDTAGLKRIHTILIELITNGITDTKTSFIDLSEYAESCINDIEQQGVADAPSNTMALRKLIAADFEK